MYQRFFKKLYHNVYARIRRNPGQTNVTITVSFTVNGKSFEATTIKSISEISTLKEIAEFHKPESIMVLVNIANKKTVYREDFIKANDASNMHQESIKHQSKVNNSSPNQDLNIKPTQMDINNLSIHEDAVFNGFGEVNVKKYVNKILEEERQIRKLSDLENELAAKNEEIVKLHKIISNHESSLTQHEQEIEEYQSELQTKGQIRYWAGLTGDILESIGIKKETLRAPLAGFLTNEEEQNTQQKVIEDQTGFVEDNPKNDKRTELITLIHEFLQQVDNATLSNIFRIFSDIEQDKNLSEYIIQQLELKKQKADENI